jgi:hypothetical protein
MSANAYAYKETAEERARVDAALAKMGVTRSTRASADVVSIDHAKKPLGLGIILDDNERAAERDDDDPTGGWQGFSFGKDKDKAFLESAVTFSWLFYFLDILGGVTLSLHNDIVKEINTALWDDIKRKFREADAERRVEIAELKATIAEMRAEVSALRSVQETQRIQSRGEMGVPGPRGVPGATGPVGPAGPQGPRGEAAATIVEWSPDPQRFVLTPILGDGTRGVSAHLLPFFEQFDSMTRSDDEE